MAATAGVSPSHLLLEVEVEEMHGCMYSICSVIVPGRGWVEERVGGYCILCTYWTNGLVHTYISIYSTIPTYYACQLSLHISRALGRLEKHDKCSSTTITIRGSLPSRPACLILSSRAFIASAGGRLTFTSAKEPRASPSRPYLVACRR